jgi:polar amino acid transport system substrate-binding protein
LTDHFFHSRIGAAFLKDVFPRKLPVIFQYDKEWRGEQSMKKLGVLIVLVLVVSVCAFSTGTAGEVIDRILERGYVTLGTTGEQPPLSIRNKDGEMIGLDVDLALLIALSMGVKLNVEQMPFGELLPALESGKVDMIISAMTITPERNLKVAFVGPYFVTGKGLVTTRKNLEKAENLNSLNLPEMRIVALRNSTSQQFVERYMNRVKLITTPSTDAGIQMLIRGEADAMIADYHYCAVAALKHADEGLIAGLARFTFEPLGIALPEDDPLFINWINNFLLTMKGSGDLDIFTRRWFENPSWLEELP